MIRRALALAAATGAASALALACVDLFHATNFATLCDFDASACATTDAGPPDVAAPPADLSLCRAAPAAVAQTVCARLGACVGSLGTTRFGECTVEAQLAYDCEANPGMRPLGDRARLWSCLERATTCEAVRSCVFSRSSSQPCDVKGGTVVGCGTANPTTRVACKEGQLTSVAVDTCLATGRTCAAPFANAGGVCAGRQSDRCGGLSAPACVDTSAVDCQAVQGAEKPVDLGVDCATTGAGTCANTLAGPACLPAADAGGAACSEAPPTCDGKIVRACVGNVPLAIDCGKLGLDCVALDTPRPYDLSAYCRKPSNDCVEPDRDVCAGTSVVSCRRGEVITIDCVSSGYGPCQSTRTENATCLEPAR